MHLMEVSSLTEDCRHGVPLVRGKEDLEQRGGEDIRIDDALTGESLDQKRLCPAKPIASSVG